MKIQRARQLIGRINAKRNNIARKPNAHTFF